MIRLLGLVYRENRPLVLLSKNLKFHSHFIKNEEDTFGVSSKFSQSDSGINKIRIDLKNRIPDSKSDSISERNKFYKKKTSSKRNLKTDTSLVSKQNIKVEVEEKFLDDSDTFGSQTNEFKNISFLNKIGYSKPLKDEFEPSESKAIEKQEKLEDQYDKVLNHIRLSNSPNERINTENFYVNKMNQLEKEGKIKEAIDVFFKEMIEKDRFKPTLWVYKNLMIILARAGYTHMVFTLFKRLVKSKQDEWLESNTNKTLNQIITLLFHSCAKCEWPEYAIKKTDSIRFYLKNRGLKPNRIQYAAMIASYGRSGALYEAFNCVDEMILNGTKPDIDIFNNLLCGCITHKNVFGFKYALAVWQMCLKFKIKPNLNTYNLLLKAARDCTEKKSRNDLSTNHATFKTSKKLYSREKNLFPVNTEEHLMFLEKEKDANQNETLKSNISPNLIKKLSNNIELVMEANENNVQQDQISDTIQLNQKDVHIIEDMEVVGKSIGSQIANLEWWQEIKPNIDTTELMRDLSKHKPELKEILKLKSHDSVLTNPKFDMEKANLNIDQETKLINYEVLGGIDGLCMAIKAHKVKPDSSFFNTLLLICPNNTECEEKLIAQMNNFNIKPTIEFCNFLIKRRLSSSRNEFKNADIAFKMIQKNQLTPNIITFGCLAYKIYSKEEMDEFLSDLKNMNLHLNIKIVQTLYTNGFRIMKSFGFLYQLFETVKKENVLVDNVFLKTVENDLNAIKMKIIDLEKRSKKSLSDEETRKYKKMEKFYGSFKKYFDTWSKDVKLAPIIHPYEKFSREDDRIFKSHIRNTQKYMEEQN